MARPKGYDMDSVLDQAMQIFWQKGYEATTINDIVKATNLKPGSLYAIFGNKEGIFESVMHHYMALSIKKVESIFSDIQNPKKSIAAFLDMALYSALTNQDTRGCLIVKTLLHSSHTDKKIQDKITQFYNKLEPMLAKSIQKLKDLGLSDVDPKYYAQFIITIIYGNHAYYKISGDKSKIRNDIKYILTLLYCYNTNLPSEG